MEQTRNQKVLRQRFLFRVIIMVLSGICCILYGFFNSCCPAFWGVILGLSGSALVWSFVELFDFFIETYQQFTNERCQFFIMTEHHWSQLRSIFRTEVNIEKIPWDKVSELVDNLYSETAAFPFQGGVYAISKEFETAATYITRLYWKTHGYIHSREKKNTREYWEPFYKTFVFLTSEVAKEPAKTFTDFSRINDQIDALRKIDISFLDFNHPKGMVYHDELGDLGESISIPSGEMQYKTFKPAYNFHQKFHEKFPHGAFFTIASLMLRRIKKWK